METPSSRQTGTRSSSRLRTIRDHSWSAGERASEARGRWETLRSFQNVQLIKVQLSLGAQLDPVVLSGLHSKLKFPCLLNGSDRMDGVRHSYLVWLRCLRETQVSGVASVLRWQCGKRARVTSL